MFIFIKIIFIISKAIVKILNFFICVLQNEQKESVWHEIAESIQWCFKWAFRKYIGSWKSTWLMNIFLPCLFPFGLVRIPKGCMFLKRNQVNIFVIFHLIKISKALLPWKTGNFEVLWLHYQDHKVQVYQWHHKNHHQMIIQVLSLLQEGYLHLQMSCQGKCHHEKPSISFSWPLEVTIFLRFNILEIIYFTFLKRKTKTKCCQTLIIISNHYQIRQGRKQWSHCIAFK